MLRSPAADAVRPSRTEFESLVLGHLDALHASALRLTRHERDAEDLVQDTVLRAYRFFDRFERGTNVKAWLFRILTNVFINRHRRASMERVGLEDERETVQERFISQEMSRHGEHPEQQYMERLLGDDVVAALDALPDDFRLVVVLADLQEFSYREIADIVGCPVGTVMSRLSRGRKLLQRSLLRHAIDRGIIDLPADVSDAEAAEIIELRRRGRLAGEGR